MKNDTYVADYKVVKEAIDTLNVINESLMQYSVKKINTVISAGGQMSQGQTCDSLNGIVNTLESTEKAMSSLIKKTQEKLKMIMEDMAVIEAKYK